MIEGRPNLSSVITGIIYSIEKELDSAEGLRTTGKMTKGISVKETMFSANIDEDKSGDTDEEEGKGVCTNQESFLGFRPWLKNDEQEQYVKGLDKNFTKDWGMMYCGGSKPIMNILREISFDCHVDLHVDSFSW